MANKLNHLLHPFLAFMLCISITKQEINQKVANCIEYDQDFPDFCVDCDKGFGLRRDCPDFSCKNRCDPCPQDYSVTGCDKDSCGWAWVDWSSPFGTPDDKIKYIELALCSKSQDIYFLGEKVYYGISVPKTEQKEGNDTILYTRFLRDGCTHCMGNCKACDNFSTCTSCNEGFTLSEKGYCKIESKIISNYVMVSSVFLLLLIVFFCWCRPYYHIIKKDRIIAPL